MARCGQAGWWAGLLIAGAVTPGHAATPPLAVRNPPAVITVATGHGEARLPVTQNGPAGPGVPGNSLVAALNGGLQTGEPWIEVTLARQSFKFLLGAPLLLFNDRLQPLAGWAVLSQDTLYLPLQFVTEILPEVLSERYSCDPALGRLVDSGGRPPPPRAPARLPNGLLPGHVVTVDAGHGGVDPGNPGLYFPQGVHEKDVNLQVALLLRQALKRQGVEVVMTRTSDTLISLLDRARYCTAECDLFVSLHVDALDPRSRGDYRSVRGFHTIIIGEKNTEDADRIARMENDALRYEKDGARPPANDLDFILRNLQMNEYLRESARAAELVQGEMDQVLTGDNRGVDQSNRLAVLNTAQRPAILIEMGYSTNPQDARLLTRRKSQEALATAIAQAIVEYLKEYERKTAAAGAGSGR